MYWYVGVERLMRWSDIVGTSRKISRRTVAKKARQDYVTVLGPYRQQAEAEQAARRMGIPVHPHRHVNPPHVRLPATISTRGAVEIYENIEAIEATKGAGSLWPKEHFRHDFKGKRTRIFGLKNGALLVLGEKRLWKTFQYSKHDGTRMN